MDFHSFAHFWDMNYQGGDLELSELGSAELFHPITNIIKCMAIIDVLMILCVCVGGGGGGEGPENFVQSQWGVVLL